jgi:hypothetical protein
MRLEETAPHKRTGDRQEEKKKRKTSEIDTVSGGNQWVVIAVGI